MIERANHVVLLADKTKFESRSFAYLASMSEIDVIRSDADYPAEFEKTPEASAIKFIHVDVT